MSFKVTRLTVGKGKTTGNEKESTWTRQYFELEAEIESEQVIELAKGSMEALIDTWLRGELINQQPKEAAQENKAYDPEKIKWDKAQGSSGPYERSEDTNSLDHKALLKDLAAHSGKFRRSGFFYWTFKNGSTIGRKIVK